MLEKTNATKAVREAVKKELNIDLTWEEVFRMKPITQTPHGPGLTILALQKGDLTIMARVNVNEVLGIVDIDEVKSCSW